MKKLTFMIIGIVAVALVLSGTVMAGGKGKGKLKLTDAYLITFTREFGQASLDSKLDLAKKGVGFAVSSLGPKKIGMSNKFVVPTGLDANSGCTGPFNGDCSAFKKLELEFKNLGPTDVDVQLFMNTGLTDPGFASCLAADAKCDVYWQNTWTTVPAGKKKKVKLDFSNAEAFNCDGLDVDGCADLGTGYGGTGLSILRLDEVTDIGFQIADWTGNSSTSTWVIVRGGGAGKDNDGDSDSN